jgi:hypothetical protein
MSRLLRRYVAAVAYRRANTGVKVLPVGNQAGDPVGDLAAVLAAV